MQWADVYACMWGGDSIHALHLRRGALVIEMINHKFLQHGPWAWVRLRTLCCSAYPPRPPRVRTRTRPTLSSPSPPTRPNRHPPPTSARRQRVSADMPTLRPPDHPTPDPVQISQHKRWVTKQRGVRGTPPLRYSMVGLNFSGTVLTDATRTCMARKTKAWEAKRQEGDKRALKEDEPGGLWECYWNSNMRVEWAQLHGAIVRAVRAAVQIDAPQTVGRSRVRG